MGAGHAGQSEVIEAGDFTRLCA